MILGTVFELFNNFLWQESGISGAVVLQRDIAAVPQCDMAAVVTTCGAARCGSVRLQRLFLVSR